MGRLLFWIKFLHTVIFMFMVACIVWVGYCAVARRYDWTLGAALLPIFIEGIVLLLNRCQCPVTTLTRRVTGLNAAVTDLFMPRVIADNTFRISTVIVAIELIALAVGYFTR